MAILNPKKNLIVSMTDGKDATAEATAKFARKAIQRATQSLDANGIAVMGIEENDPLPIAWQSLATATAAVVSVRNKIGKAAIASAIAANRALIGVWIQGEALVCSIDHKSYRQAKIDRQTGADVLGTATSDYSLFAAFASNVESYEKCDSISVANDRIKSRIDKRVAREAAEEKAREDAKAKADETQPNTAKSANKAQAATQA